jgi:hypothetical protein
VGGPEVLRAKLSAHLISVVPILVREELIEAIQVSQVAGPDAADGVHLIASRIGSSKILRDPG